MGIRFFAQKIAETFISKTQKSCCFCKVTQKYSSNLDKVL